MQPNTTVWYHRHYLHHCLVAVVCNSLWGCRGRSGNSVVTSQATLARWTGVTLVLLCRYLFQPLIVSSKTTLHVWMHMVLAASTRSCANIERIRSVPSTT